MYIGCITGGVYTGLYASLPCYTGLYAPLPYLPCYTHHIHPGYTLYIHHSPLVYRVPHSVYWVYPVRALGSDQEKPMGEGQ